ncbi:aldehyde dehydrogenase family protein [Nocardioides sp. YIM 152588]|uniref:aldehyde dehydrogenase family protein n=1 Tax=Nocardioides sp. YIM 152588 TaxID=3158259 RepID=UPI0032E446E3
MTTAASTESVEDAVESVVARVRAGFASGLTRPLAWRRTQLEALDRMLVENGAAIEKAIHLDLGKHGLETFITESGTVRTEIKHALKNLDRWTKPRAVRAGLAMFPSKARIQREPLGTVLIVSPWNYPVHLLLMPLVGAIAAGNAVVLKPSELAPATSALMAEVLPTYLDERAVAVVEGAVEETTALLALPWDHIFYTGNGTVGRIVATAAARHLTPVTLELGGKSPVWVDPSADVDAAAHWLAWGKLLNTGQTCVAPDYVMTTAEVAPRLVEALGREITALYGTDIRNNPDYGRIVNQRHLDRLVGLLDGATVAFGGEHDRDDRYLAPTVLTDVTPASPAMQEEIFGPVLPVMVVAGHDAAIDHVNAGDKPLAMYLFARAGEVVDAFLARTSSGGVAVNANLIQIGVPALPFGGVGASGYGAYHGEASVRAFSHERSVLIKGRGPNLMRFAEPPFTDKKNKMLRGKSADTQS